MTGYELPTRDFIQKSTEAVSPVGTVSSDMDMVLESNLERARRKEKR
jgi:hypothetical protein